MFGDRSHASPETSPHYRHPSGGRASPDWNFSGVPLYPSAHSAGPSSGSRQSGGFPAASRLQIDLSAIQFQPVAAARAQSTQQADGSLEDLYPDQDSLTPSVFERKPSGRGIHIRVPGGHPGPTADYKGGIRWMQTIRTNKPLFGQTSPYVDFIPPKDDKPFYFSDAGETSTFSDNPSRSANGVEWDATLSLVGVNNKAITRIDSVNYGFDINASGTLTAHQPSKTGVSDLVVHGDTLRSEYSDWVFSGGFAVPQVPAPGGATASGTVQASRLGGSSGNPRPANPHFQPLGSSHPEPAPRVVHEALRSPGQPLREDTRSLMESRFHHDFSRVRVHTDSKAAESSAAIGAAAYTVGRHIVFGGAAHTLGSLESQRLLAHELRHTQQQEAMGGSGSLVVAPPDTGLEKDAERAARRIVS